MTADRPMPDTPPERETCETCRFWDNSTQRSDAEPDMTGLCRRWSPTAHPLIAGGAWPFTEDTDWCGEFVAKETRCRVMMEAHDAE